MGFNGSDLLLLVNTGTPGVPVYEVVGSQRNVAFQETTGGSITRPRTAGHSG